MNSEEMQAGLTFLTMILEMVIKLEVRSSLDKYLFTVVQKSHNEDGHCCFDDDKQYIRDTISSPTENNNTMGKETIPMKISVKVLPVIPLPTETVLLPGVNLRILLKDRDDIAAILSSRSDELRDFTSIKDITVLVGCVPLQSPLFGPAGQKLIDNGDSPLNKKDITNPAQVTSSELYKYGTLARITGIQTNRQNETSLVVQGLSRFIVEEVEQKLPFIKARVNILDHKPIDEFDKETRNLFGQLKRSSRELLAILRLSSLLSTSRSKSKMSPLIAQRLDQVITQAGLKQAVELASFMVNLTNAPFEEKLRMLSAQDLKEIMEIALAVVESKLNSLQGIAPIVAITSVANDLKSDENHLPSRSSRSRNSEVDTETNDDMEELKEKLNAAELSPEARKVADRELSRLQKMSPMQTEYQINRTYLETLTELPWAKFTKDTLDSSTLTRARKQLDADHYSLDKVKKRILEYLAVLRLKSSSKQETSEQTSEAQDTKSLSRHSQDLVNRSPILLLVGPPGVGKTSLAHSIANSLGRKFHRISLGGVRDEAEIRGHRRTYVAAMPGVIVGGLKKVGVNNPVFLLDEIDKVGKSSFHGDPSAAMLEVLDPEQNHTFTDHYLNIPIDLSKVLFIATANTLDTIPPALLDRMETIELTGYTTLEKKHIAVQHLIPKQIITNGLQEKDIDLQPAVIDEIITSYTHEAGVRNLEREIGSVCRYKAVQYSDSLSIPDKSYNPTVSIPDLEDILGVSRYEEEVLTSDSRPGVVTGLVAYSTISQGSIIFIEVVDVPLSSSSSSAGQIILTGKLGDVLKESVQVALTWVRANAYLLNLVADPKTDIAANRSIHVHCPSGAIPKDGPSAGLAHTVALISLFSNKVVPSTIAMTGEVSLRGKVLPVGGIRQKLIGAMRAGVKKVILPFGNRKDMRDLPDEVKAGMDIVHVSWIWEALKIIWPEMEFREENTTKMIGLDSRL